MNYISDYCFFLLGKNVNMHEQENKALQIRTLESWQTSQTWKSPGKILLVKCVAHFVILLFLPFYLSWVILKDFWYIHILAFSESFKIIIENLYYWYGTKCTYSVNKVLNCT